jgi:hypothetical protein
MFTIEYVKDLKWCNEEHTVIECTVKYAEFNEEHPTGVNATDPYPHINEIWTKANAGEYGVIAEYEPPYIPVVDMSVEVVEETVQQETVQQETVPQENTQTGI